MKYEQIANLVFNQPWALLPSKYAEVANFISFKVEGGEYSKEAIQAIVEAAGPTRQASRSGAVAVLPLSGVMSQKIGLMGALSGGTGTEAFGKMFKEAVADPAIGGIVIDIDSPGGSVFGVQELAQTIFNARGTKPIVAMINSMGASAAYWVAAQADEIIITPGGQAGSIGVFTAHNDVSAMLEAEGQNITLINAGKKKVDGNPFGPLSEEAEADLQASVDAYYTSFVNAVAKGRGVTANAVRNGFGEGGVLGAEASKQSGLVDRIGTLDIAIAKAGGRGGFQALVDDGTISANLVDSLAKNIETAHTVVQSVDIETRLVPPEEGDEYERHEATGKKTYFFEVHQNEPLEEEPEPVDDTDLRRRRLNLQGLTRP